MVTVIKKGTPIKDQLKQVNEVVAKKEQSFSASKYSGILKRKINPLEYQAQLRNEWK